jgi:hypothetical protein
MKRQTIDSLPPNFKPHPDWPGYGGDIDGNIYSHIPPRRPVLLKPWVKGCGHHSVSLRRDGKTHKILVHRFILELFVGRCPPGLEGCHGEEGAAVNALRNLRWDTHQENTRDRFRHGELYGKQKLTPDQVHEIKRLRQEGKKLREIASQFGVTETTVSHVANGKTWGVLA